MERATSAYANQLKNVRPGSDSFGVLPYLTEHCIDYATATDYLLGLVDEPVNGDERFRGMLAIPYLSPRGVKAMKFRRLGEEGPKYNSHHGQKPRLYNPAAFFAADNAIGLCEGEIDAIVATERLGCPTMGIPGSDTWSRMASVWSPVFKDFRTVYVFADGDDAGKRLASDVAETLGWRVRLVECDRGEDVASMVRAGYADKLKKLASE